MRDSLGGSGMTRDAIDFLVLDAVADDVESVPHIRSCISASGEGSTLLEALHRLTRDRLIEGCTIAGTKPELIGAGEGAWPQGSVEEMWFRLTARGRMVHSAWASDAEAGTA